MTADLFEAPLEIYTDGACSGNPGPGGWGVLIRQGDDERTLKGGAPETTNNRMELQAAIEALTAIGPGGAATIITDSSYVKDGITRWIANWKARGWKTADKKPVKNQDLWQALDTLQAARQITWQWVKGHAGNAGNERADQLARDGMAPFLPEPKVQSPPPGMQRIIPMLVYRDAPAALEFLSKAFGFRKRDAFAMKDGRIGHAEMALGDNIIMLASVFAEMGQAPPGDGGYYSQIFCYVDDVDAHFERARDNGATITAEPADQPFGERQYRAEDPEGHRWIFGKHIKDVSAEEMRQMIGDM